MKVKLGRCLGCCGEQSVSLDLNLTSSRQHEGVLGTLFVPFAAHVAVGF
jgi:hypothetical protein